MTLFDVQQRITLAELSTPFIKYVVWNADMSSVALLSKHAIVIADKKLGNAQTVHETIRVKSAAWDDSGVLLYTTLNHIKYCLPNGDNGIIRTLDTPLYITRVAGNTIYALDRDGKTRAIQVCWRSSCNSRNAKGQGDQTSEEVAHRTECVYRLAAAGV
jgi:coatomer protein complex subunit alpha (xenin)